MTSDATGFMKWKRILGWTAAVIAALIVIVVVGGYFVLRSSSFHRWALAKVIEKTDQATGGRAQAQSLEINPGHLTATLRGFVLHGKESPRQKPLLSVDELTVGVNGKSLLHGHLGLSELDIRHPVAHLYVDATGGSNFPTPQTQKQSDSSFSLFKTTIDHALLSNGEIFYNNSKSQLQADVYDLSGQTDFNSLLTRYRGNIGYDHGQITYADYPPLNSGLQIHFTATPSTFSLAPLQVNVGNSHFLLRADLTNYGDPQVNGSYQIFLHTQDFSNMIAVDTKASGDINVSGAIHYHNIPNQPALDAVSLNGQVDGPSLYFENEQAALNLRALRGGFQLQNGNLQINGVAVNVLDGEIRADFAISNLGATPKAQFKAVFRNLSLQAAKASLRAPAARQVPVIGSINGTLDGGWAGSVKNILLHSDTTLHGEIRSSHEAQMVPVNGSIHAIYNGQQGTLRLHDTRIATPGTFLTANGTVSQRSQLSLQAGTDNLRGLGLLASALSKSGESPIPKAISGSATLNATVQGSIKQPRLNAQVAAHNLVVRGTEWQSLQLTAQADSSHISIQNGSLINAHQGTASFSGQVGLHQWSLTPSSPLHANSVIKNISIAQLEDLAGKSFPLEGNLNADLSLNGSEMEPVGHGSLRIVKGRIQNEPLNNFILQFNAAQGVVHSTLNAAIPAGAVTVQAAFTPKTKAYEFHMNAPGVVLGHLAVVQDKNLPLIGTLQATANGKGTLENPQLTASLQIPELQFQKTKAGAVQLQLQVASHKADLSIHSDVAQASLQAKATVNLSDNYETVASLDTTSIPLAPLFATYVTALPAEFQGSTEVHATIKGPLKNPFAMEAHLTIPSFQASYHELQVANAGPIQVNYANAVAVLERGELRGTNTDLHFSGTIPVHQMQALTVKTTGNVNLKLLQMFDPSVTSSGNLTLDLQAGGEGHGLQGKIQLKNAAFSTETAPITLEKLNATLDVKPDRVRIADFSGQVGGGTISATGFITYRPQMQFNVSMQAKSIRIRYPEGLRTVLDSSLNFTGTTQAASLNGRVLIDSISFTPDFDLASFAGQLSGNSLPAPSQGFTNRIKLGISLQTAGQFRASSSQISLEGDANLQVIGTASNPVIVGRTDLTSGEVFFMKKRYELQRGIINFVNPNRTEPVVNVLIAVTVEQYNLSITLVGPVDRLRTEYVSDPPLPPVDIINLIARGQTTEESTPGNFGANSILASGIASELSSSIGKLAGFSSIQIDPLLSDNGRDPSARIAIQQRVSKNLLFTFSTDVTQPQSEIIQGEYQVNRRWSVSASRDESGGVAVDARYHTNF